MLLRPRAEMTANPSLHTTSDSRSRAALAAAVLGFFIVTFDAVVVNVALPSIRADLGGGIAGLQWVVDGYTLMFAALLLAAGAFSDRAGARRAFTIGVVVFAAASAACGLAPGLAGLIAARFVQGSAAAVMMPASMALIGQAYPDPSWRLIFLINIPVGIIAVALVARAQRSPRRDVAFDAFGFVTAVLAMGALTFGAIEAGVRGFTALAVVA